MPEDPKPRQQPQQQQQRQAPEVSQQEAQEAQEELLRTSSDASFSTYRKATDDELDLADEALPPGPHVMQERGEPTEGGGERFSAKRHG